VIEKFVPARSNVFQQSYVVGQICLFFQNSFDKCLSPKISIFLLSNSNWFNQLVSGLCELVEIHRFDPYWPNLKSQQT
jgi:hypothetical protein